MMRSISRTLLLIGVSLVSSHMAHAQTAAPARQEVDLAFTYQAQMSNTTGGNAFWMQGGGGELSAEVHRGFGIALNVSGQKADNVRGGGVNLATITTTVGPRYTWRPSNQRLALFGQALIGESHAFNGAFPSRFGAISTYDSFALQVGGGININLNKRFAIRALDANWVQTGFPNATTNVQNNMRLGAGIVLRLQ